jgi:hypothetical protein
MEMQMHPRCAVVVLTAASGLLLAACPGVAATPWDHWPDHRHREVRRLGCVELGFAVGHDPRIPESSLLLDLGVRNHCVRPARFDALALEFVGHQTGLVWQLRIYDPGNEIRLAEIDSEREGIERLRLDPVGDPLTAAITSICVDTSHISPEAAQAAPEPLCVEVSP